MHSYPRTRIHSYTRTLVHSHSHTLVHAYTLQYGDVPPLRKGADGCFDSPKGDRQAAAGGEATSEAGERELDERRREEVSDGVIGVMGRLLSPRASTWQTTEAAEQHLREPLPQRGLYPFTREDLAVYFETYNPAKGAAINRVLRDV
jgi:hypothetical protein